MITDISILLFLSLFAGILGRMGGGGHDLWLKLRFFPKWFFDTKARDIGIPLCMILCSILTGYFHWILLVCFFTMFGANTWSGKKKGQDSKFYNWLFLGLAMSFAMLPYAYITGHWIGFGLRTLIVTAFVTIISEVIGNDFLEEFSRAFIQVITLPLLLL